MRKKVNGPGKQKRCSACSASLVPLENWRASDVRSAHYRCRLCRKKQENRKKRSPFSKRTGRLRGVGKATAVQLRALYEKQGGKCAFSGLPLSVGTTSLDHKTPKARGGADSIDNLQFLHRSINGMKHDMTMEEFTEFFDKVAFQRLLGDAA